MRTSDTFFGKKSVFFAMSSFVLKDIIVCKIKKKKKMRSKSKKKREKKKSFLGLPLCIGEIFFVIFCIV